MTHLDHIAELRAELAQCVLTRNERAQIERELTAALAVRSAERTREGDRAPDRGAGD